MGRKENIRKESKEMGKKEMEDWYGRKINAEYVFYE